MNLSLKKFDITNITSDKVCVFIGKRETGKSFLVKDLLYYHQHIPIGTVISGTEGANTFYGKIIPNLFIHELYSPEIIKNALKRQKIVVKKMQKETQTRGYTNIDPSAFLILDDCLYDSSWIKDPNIRCLFMNGRHYKMLFLITMQYALGIPPNLRTNIDYVFILRENYVSNRKKLYEHYAGMFPTFEVFNQVMNQCTENYECLVIHNNAKSNKLEDQVFWYKAEEHPQFRIGAPEFWQHHSNNFNDNSDEEDDFDFTACRKRGPTINVKKHY
tara:strand:+ start:2023 stop:2841 length:819 start_codon:yes stop_codon:yes gene_type:complete